MAHLSKFGLENFRVFKDETIFDFAPLTILTGPNSSGKSTILKSLLLLNNNLKKDPDIKKSILKFEVNNPNYHHWLPTNINSFDECLTINSGNEFITISIETIFPVINSKVLLKLKYKTYENHKSVNSGVLSEIQLFSIDDLSKPIYSEKHNMFLKDKTSVFTNSSNVYIDIHFFKFRLDNIINNIYDYEKSLYDLKFKIKFLNKIFSKEKLEYDSSLPLFPYLPLQLFLNRRTKNDKEFWATNPINDNWMGQIEYFRENYKLKTDKDTEIHQELVKLEGELFRKLYISPNNPRAPYIADYFDYIHKKTNDFLPLMDKELDLLINYGLGNYLSFIKSNEKRLSQNKNAEIFQEFFIYGLEKLFESLYWLKDIRFIESVRATAKRSYSYSSNENTFSQIVFDTFDSNALDVVPIKDFMKFALPLFELDELSISPNSSNSGFEVFIGDKLLSDIGYGITQLVPIILKIVSLARENIDYEIIIEGNAHYCFKPSILYIEEPETNLHPNFQSRLADLFIKAYMLFDMQFIIETHSEYLIRKLQYLTAKNDIKPEDTAIYYFNNPNNIPEGEKQVKKIRIKPNGVLDGNFGTGFIDEASILIREIFKASGAN